MLNKITGGSMGIKWMTQVQQVDTDDLSRITRVREMLDEINEDLLDGRQAEFIMDVYCRLDEHGDSTKFSDAQYNWIRGIWETQTGQRRRRH